MPDLRDKCVKWINKHLAQVWNTKELLTLPREMLEMCLKVAVDDLVGFYDSFFV
ncbi:hypothetical protein DPMN_156380 [Dreissena polymorpha]|uniref:BTBD8 BACK domain-containing protein n=1 Tax=Dreissena polymorpha TaxID=45954 RepID=A0A9D4J8R6_DREPO|nr:hypothetical protein DPMN_156380 [Dreissena polymorpha]